MTRIDDSAVAGRLNELMQEKRSKSVRAFALSIDADPSFFNKVLKCERSIPESMIKSLEEKYKVNPKWILFGQSPKYGHFVPHETTSPKAGIPIENGTVTIPISELVSVIKAAQESILAEKEARRLDAEVWLQKEKEEKNRLFNLLEQKLARLVDDSDTILAYQKAWVDLHAEELHPEDIALQKRMLAKMGRLVGERKYGPLPKGNVEAQGKTSKGKQGQHP